MTTLNEALNCRVLYRLPKLGVLEIVKFSAENSASMILEGYRGSGLVEYAELDQPVHLALAPLQPGSRNRVLRRGHRRAASVGPSHRWIKHSRRLARHWCSSYARGLGPEHVDKRS